MALSEKDHELIEKFVFARLNQEEQAEFDSRLQDDEFAAEVALQNDMDLAFVEEGRSHLKIQLQGFEENRKEQKKIVAKEATQFTIGRILSIAAGFTFLLLAAYWIFIPSSNTDQLFADYYQPYPNVIAPITKGQDTIAPRELAFQFYEKKEYNKAINEFSEMKGDEDAAFYKGLALLAIGNLDEAKTIFESIIVDENHKHHFANDWYLSLIYIKQGNLRKAKQLLQEVLNNESHPFNAKAKLLIKEI